MQRFSDRLILHLLPPHPPLSLCVCVQYSTDRAGHKVIVISLIIILHPDTTRIREEGRGGKGNVLHSPGPRYRENTESILTRKRKWGAFFFFLVIQYESRLKRPRPRPRLSA